MTTNAPDSPHDLLTEPRTAGARRVAFYAREGLHRAVVEPVARAVGDRLAWSILDHAPDVIEWAPDILVMPSFRDLGRFRMALPDTLIGSVRHGLIGKRGHERLRKRPASRILDFLAVGDEWTIERYQAAGLLPASAWMTGYPQMDPLFRRDPPAPHGLPPDQPIVLYAPTWTEGLSSAPMLGERIAELVRGDGPPLGLIIKPHPLMESLQPGWLAGWRAVADSDPRVVLVDGRADVTGFMLAADLLISDASSTIFEFLALDRPIVLVTNPAAMDDPSYDPDDLPWAWRDVGDEVTDVESLPAVVRQALAEPTARAARREAAAAVLFGDFRDGRNAERIADHIVGLAAGMDDGTAPAPFRPPPRVPSSARPVRRPVGPWRRRMRGLRRRAGSLLSSVVFGHG